MNIPAPVKQVTDRIRRARRRERIIAALAFAAIVAGFLWVNSEKPLRSVTAHFSQAVSIYPGSSVDVMGIPIGHVTAVVPEGDTVRVEMAYDPRYNLPANVSAAIVSPTLVGDRFIQLAPAYSGGAALPDGGDIPRTDPVTGKQRTAEPVEIDQIYSSLSQLSTTLGPSGANKNGALSDVLNASAKALKGNGMLGNAALKNLAAAVSVLGRNSPQLFSTVDGLSQLSGTLQANDALVGTFLTRLAGVSTQLGGESDQLKQALAAIASALGTVQTFVHDNRAALKGDVQQLTQTLQVLNGQRATLAQVLQMAPLGLDNLTEAFDSETGTVGIRLQLGPAATDLGNVLCGILKVNKMPNVDQACTLLRALLPGSTSVGAGVAPQAAPAATPAPPGGLAGILNPVLRGLG